MSLVLSLPPEIEQYLLEKAKEKGVSLEAYTLQLLMKYVAVEQKQAKLVDLLESWVDGDPDEQKETGEFLIESLDQNRLSDRQLFPTELKGISW